MWIRINGTMSREKCDFLFRFVAPEIRENIKYDEESLYSVTDQITANKITRDLIKYVPKTSAAILDATACIGGNTISFAETFEHVYACEMNQGRAAFLCENLRLLGIANYSLYVGDCMDFIKSTKRVFDLIFLDPPWGGRSYKTEKSIHLYLSGRNLTEVIPEIAPHARYIAIKTPVNFNCGYFIEETRPWLEVKAVNKNLRKMILIIAEVRTATEL